MLITEEELYELDHVARFIYDRGNGKQIAFIHRDGGVQIWDKIPELWKGWKLGFNLFHGKESY